MNAFQLVGTAGTLLFALLSLVRALRNARGRGAYLTWSLVWLLGCVAIYRPEITREVAVFLGIQRGADLVAYATTLTILTFLFYFQYRAQKHEQQVTLMVRRIALLEGRLGKLSTRDGERSKQ